MAKVIKAEVLSDCISALDYSPEGESLSAGLIDETTYVWSTDYSNFKQKYKFDGNGLGVIDLKFNKEGNVLAISSLDSTINIISMDDGSQISQINCGPMENWKITFDETGRRIITAAELGLVRIYDSETKELMETLKTIDIFATCIAYSPNGKYMAVGNNMGNIFIFDMKSDKVPRKFETHGKIVRSLEFTRDSLKLISASDDQHINIIDLPSMNTIVSLTGHSGNINSLSAHPKNPKVFASSSFDKTIKIWDLDKRESVENIGNQDEVIWTAKFSHDGQHLASGGENGSLKIYSLV